MQTLIIHHLESMWQESYKSIGGITFLDLCYSVLTHIETKGYDRVILTRFEETTLESEHYDSGLSDYIDDIFEYAYGWTADMFDDSDKNVRYVDGGSHSEVVLIDDWMKDLIADNVSICGAFDGECIEDLEIALESQGIKYNRIEGLII